MSVTLLFYIVKNILSHFVAALELPWGLHCISSHPHTVAHKRWGIYCTLNKNALTSEITRRDILSLKFYRHWTQETTCPLQSTKADGPCQTLRFQTAPTLPLCPPQLDSLLLASSPKCPRLWGHEIFHLGQFLSSDLLGHPESEETGSIRGIVISMSQNSTDTKCWI